MGYNYQTEQKKVKIGNVEFGGDPRMRATVCVGTMFYEGHKAIGAKTGGVFDNELAMNAIKTQIEWSDKTGIPCALDCVFDSTEHVSEKIDFLMNNTPPGMPLFLDGLATNIKAAYLEVASQREKDFFNRCILNSISGESQEEELDLISKFGVKNVLLLLHGKRAYTVTSKMEIARDLIKKMNDRGLENILIDTAVMDLPSLGVTLETVRRVKNELGIPVGCGAHNAVATWEGLKVKFGKQMKMPARITANLLPVSWGADFSLYGPIEHCDVTMLTIAMINTASTQLLMESAETKKILRTLKDHPKSKIA